MLWPRRGDGAWTTEVAVEIERRRRKRCLEVGPMGLADELDIVGAGEKMK